MRRRVLRRRHTRVSRDPSAPFSVSLTYDVVTPESAEHGDVEDRGYVYEDERMSLGDVVREMNRRGPWEEVQVDRHLLRAYESEGSVNYRTGAETTHAIHVRGSERAIKRLAQYLESGHASVRFPRAARDRRRTRRVRRSRLVRTRRARRSRRR